MGYYEEGLGEAREQLNKDLAKLGDVHPNYLKEREKMLEQGGLFNAARLARKAGDSNTADSLSDQWRQSMDKRIRKNFAESGSTHLLDEKIMHTNPDGSLKPGRGSSSKSGGSSSGGSVGGSSSGVNGSPSQSKSGGNNMNSYQAGQSAREMLGKAGKAITLGALGPAGLALAGGAALGAGAMRAMNGDKRTDRDSEYGHYDDEFELNPYQQQLGELNSQAREDSDIQGDAYERTALLNRELGKDTSEQEMYEQLAVQGQMLKAQEAQNVLNNASDRMKTIGGTIQAAAANRWY